MAVLAYRSLLHLRKSCIIHDISLASSGGFRPGLGGTGHPVLLQAPPQFRGHPLFLFAKITQICDLFAFPNFRKIAKFAVSIESLKT